MDLAVAILTALVDREQVSEFHSKFRAKALNLEFCDRPGEMLFVREDVLEGPEFAISLRTKAQTVRSIDTA